MLIDFVFLFVIVILIILIINEIIKIINYKKIQERYKKRKITTSNNRIKTEKYKEEDKINNVF